MTTTATFSRTLKLILFCPALALAEQVTITAPLPLPISGSLTTTPPALTTVTFNGSAQQVTSTYTVVTDTWNINVNVVQGGGSLTVTPGTGTFAVSGASGGGAAQFVNVSGSTVTPSYQGTISSFPVNVINNPLTVGFNGIGQQVTSTYTVVTDTWNVNMNIQQVNGTAVSVNGDGGINVHTVNSSGSGGGAAANFGAAFPSSGTATGWVGNNGNMQGAAVTITSNPIVAIYSGSNTVSVNGSTLAVTNVNGANLNINIAAGSIGNTGFNVNNAPTVVTSTAAVNGSTMAVVNAQNTSLTVNITSGSISNTSFGATQSGAWTVNAVPSTGSFTVVPFSSGTYTVTQGSGNASVPWTVGNSTIGIVGTLADNGVAAGTNRLPTLPTIYQTDYLNGVAATQGRNGALSQGTDGLLWTANLPALRPGSSFAASTMAVTVAATPTDFAAIKGNAVNTTLVYGIRVSCNQTTAGTVHLNIVKRSTAYTGAWSTMTAVPEDSNYAVAQSSAIWFTANPTLGTSLGQIDSYRLECPPATTTSSNDIYISPADWRMRPIVLRSATDILAVNLFGDTIAGGSFNVSFAWTEVKTITP